MTDPLDVELNGTVIATAANDGDEITIRFNEAYRADPSATPLSVSMPRTAALHKAAGPAAWLWGLLPDNDDVLRRWARDYDASTRSPLSYLSTEIGLDCPGSVRFIPSDAKHPSVGRDSGVHWLSDDELEARINNLATDSTSWQGNRSVGQFSLAGAQAKTALRSDGTGRWGSPYGDEPSTHILKPSVPGFDHQQVNEHLCLSAATNLGLVAATTDIATIGDHQILVVDRFDRHETSPNEWRRIHQEDMCQALGVHPNLKYQADGGPSAADIARLINRWTQPPVSARETQRFLDALIYNWLIAGTDGHAKNYAFLHSGNQTRLAPLYDISSFLPYDDSRGHKLKLAMKIGGEYRVDRIRRTSWQRLAEDIGVDQTDLLDRCAELAERVPDAFEQAAATLAEASPFVDRLVDHVTTAASARLESLAA